MCFVFYVCVCLYCVHTNVRLGFSCIIVIKIAKLS